MESQGEFEVACSVLTRTRVKYTDGPAVPCPIFSEMKELTVSHFSNWLQEQSLLQEGRHQNHEEEEDMVLLLRFEDGQPEIMEERRTLEYYLDALNRASHIEIAPRHMMPVEVEVRG
ncbi:uncharacterized protein LOC106013295 [Aplysia californica]|uniref:Uncharacterized protein LOC106013295 n=1 Tax=Aplysia californica TaxID=6500 RepID=A0ABM1AAM3_APLCA|nr:uncharacterized protein LOC106013295 [Aplysia californica]